MLLLIVGVATAPSPSSSHRVSSGSSGAAGVDRAASGAEARRRLESASVVRDSHGSATDEAAIARAVTSAIEGAYKNVGGVNVAAQVEAETAGAGEHVHKRAIVLVQLKNLRHADDAIRGQMLDDIREALGDVLEPDDVAVVGVRGAVLYGMMASGRVGAPWARTKIDVAVMTDLDDAIGALLAEDATAAATTSASATATATATASATASAR
jgi:hypothetical protein